MAFLRADRLKAMDLRNKKLLLLSLTGVLIFSAFYVAMCSQLCIAGSGGLDFTQKATCSITPHSFVHTGIIFTMLLVLPLLGIFLSFKTAEIPSGVRVSPFRPPRFPV